MKYSYCYHRKSKKQFEIVGKITPYKTVKKHFIIENLKKYFNKLYEFML